MKTHTSIRRPSVVLLALVVVLLATSCGDDTADSTTSTEATTTSSAASTTTTTATTSTEPATTSTEATAATAETSTTQAETATSSTTTVATTTTVDVNALAEGSGCTPGTTDLGDGTWFGYVESATAAELEFDLACWFTGDAAATAAAEDGEESPPPNDYYVRNQNPQLRTIPVAGPANVTWMPNPGDPSTADTVTYADWLTGRATRDYQPGVWLTIAGGETVAILEQFVP